MTKPIAQKGKNSLCLFNLFSHWIYAWLKRKYFRTFLKGVCETKDHRIALKGLWWNWPSTESKNSSKTVGRWDTPLFQTSQWIHIMAQDAKVYKILSFIFLESLVLRLLTVVVVCKDGSLHSHATHWSKNRWSYSSMKQKLISSAHRKVHI